MRQEKIGPLYEELSKHFGVPMPKWTIVHTVLRAQRKVKNASCKVKVHYPGLFSEKHSLIIFYGTPTLNTVMHEFMHYLVYCTRKEKKE